MANIYINLPVTDLTKATAFYESLWFTKNATFSNNDASAMSRDEHLTVMLLTHEFTRWFLPATKTIANAHETCQVLNALQCNTKEEVDTLVQKALDAGGKLTIPAYDHGFMYGKDFEDLDGHIWEAFWMDVNQMPKE